MRIAHIADVHYRALSRHDEYREVFDAFADDCRKEGVDHIVVCGDIFHTKTTGMSPEYISEITWWMKRLCSVAPLHLTLGNHDGNLMNLNRQDAVTPVYEALRNDKDLRNPIHLYKDSGVFPLEEGVNLCVFSLFDEQGWERVSPKKDEYNIAIYHGPVNCAVTEVGFVLSSDVTIDRFKEYDLALLGDIHKTQYLGYREIGGVEAPWIAYPGSTLQQNYAESIEHGYLLWDIEPASRVHSVSFKGLPNPKPFITIPWTPDFSSVEVPTNSRVRVKYDRPLTQGEIQGITRHLRSNYRTIETTFSPNHVDSYKEERKKSVERLEKNVRNVDSIVSLLKKMDHKGTLKAEDWTSISDTVSSYMRQAAGKEDSARSAKWSLKELKFDNILGYGEGNVINFADLNGIVGVFGPNRVGKSSIIGALSYCLFNDSDRGSIKNVDMVNVRKPHAYARAIVDIDGTDHIIERQTVKKQSANGTMNAITSLNVFKYLDGEAITLNGEQRNDSDRLIRSLIGSSEDFMLTTLSTQDDLNRFIKEGSTYRKKVLNRFLDIDFFDDLHELAKAEVTSLKSQLKALQSTLETEPKQLEQKINDLLQEINLQESEKSKETKDLDDNLGKLEMLQSSCSTFRQRKEKERKLAELEEMLERASVEVETLEAKRKIATDKLHDSRKKLETLDVQAARDVLKTLGTLNAEKTKLEFKLKEVATEGDRKKKSIKVLSEVPCGDSYPTCKFIKNAHSDKVTLQETLGFFSSLEDELRSLVNKVESLNPRDAEDSIEYEERLKSQINTLELGLHKLEIDLNHKVERRTYLNQESTNIRGELDRIPSTPIEVESEIKAFEGRVSLQRSSIKTIEKSMLEKQVELGIRKDALQRALTTQKKIDALCDELKLKEFITGAFSKKGLPAKVLSIQLPMLNHQLSQVLAGVVDFNVEIECTDGSSLEIYIDYGDSRRIIELCSGMEKMISSLAIRAAMTTVSSVPRCDTFIIDEGFGSLDESNVEACKKLLVSMKDFFKCILIISHVPGIKDVADTIIEVQKVEKDSRVYCA